MGWADRILKLGETLAGLSFRDAEGHEMGVDRGFAYWLELTLEARRARRTIYLIGNGASASMASHFASDLAKNARLHTQVFSDLSLITAISNDIGYDQIFAAPLRMRGCAGDMLIAISSSGKSPNIIEAVEVAVELDMITVTLSSFDPGNPARGMGLLNVYIPADSYGFAETGHAAILHYWMDLVERADDTAS